MASFKEMSWQAQAGIIVAVAAVLSGVLWFLVYKPLEDQNRKDAAALEAKRSENNQLRPYEGKLTDLDRQIADLKLQLDIQRKIVPDEKEIPQFMHVMQDMASTAGVEVRKYTAKPLNTQEFYTEVPFDMEIDGPYFSVLSFFDRVAHLERIINVSGMNMAALRGRQNVGRYQYAPNESVVVNCVATTFFSHESTAAAPPPGAKGTAPAAAPPAKK